MIITSERLQLVPVSSEHAAMQLELMNTPKWLANIGDRKVYTLAKSEAYINSKMTPQFERLGFGNYVIIIKETNEQIGCVGIYDRPTLEGYDFGFALLPAFEKQGYAHEASVTLLKSAKEQFGIQHLSAITIPSNLESQRLLEKLGFVFTKYTAVSGDTEKLMLYENEL